MILYRLSIFFCFIFSGFYLIAQDATNETITEIDGIVYLNKTSEPFTGKYYENYPQEKNLGKQGHYLNGKMTGVWTWYYKDGKIKRESEYSENKKNGKTTYWYKDGQKQSEAYYKFDSLDGESVWFHQNGKKKKEAIFNNGKLISGKEWDENGNLIQGSFSTE